MHDQGLKGRVVADLGCGTGTLAIGASLLGADVVIGFDIDDGALSKARDNVAGQQLDNVELVQCDLTRFNLISCTGIFDTVIMNPPFGTKRNQGTYAWNYSEHILKKAQEWGVGAEVLAELRLDLPKSYRFHVNQCVDIAVDLFRFSK